MTDKEIIQSFITNDQNGIREAYYAWRVPFEHSIRFRTHLDPDYIDDAYQEAFIRLQQHILTGRLTEQNIQSSLLAYIKEIGYFVALEIINKRRELPISQLSPSDDEDNNLSSNDLAEGEERPSNNEDSFDPSQQMDIQERERVIRDLVEQLGAPCAPLLIGKLWENKSMAELATELGYSNADSAKAQKAKCMKKVMTFVKQKLIEYGYGYR